MHTQITLEQVQVHETDKADPSPNDHLKALVKMILSKVKTLSGTQQQIQNVNVQQDPSDMFQLLLEVLHVGTGEFHDPGSQPKHFFTDLITNDAVRALYDPSTRSEDRTRYENSAYDAYMGNIRDLPLREPITDTKVCDGRSSIVDQFMYIKLGLKRRGVPSSKFAPECLLNPPGGGGGVNTFFSERFDCHTWADIGAETLSI